MLGCPENVRGGTYGQGIRGPAARNARCADPEGAHVGTPPWIRHRRLDQRDLSRALAVEDRALYLALHRLEDKGWLESDWGLSDNNRRAKFYQLTARGRAQLRAESSRLDRYAEGLFRVLNASAWEPLMARR